MKALSLWQPYATLSIIGAKHYETRGWATNFRGELAIHAAKKPVKSVLRMLPQDVVGIILDRLRGRSPDDLPVGAVIGTVKIVDCIEITEEFVSALPAYELACGDFSIGRYAWKMEDPRAFIHPATATGHQGLWNWRPE